MIAHARKESPHPQGQKEREIEDKQGLKCDALVVKLEAAVRKIGELSFRGIPNEWCSGRWALQLCQLNA